MAESNALPKSVSLDGAPLTPEQVEAVARHNAPVELHPDVRTRIQAARAVVDSIADGTEAVYGVNTGFGSLSRVRIIADDLRAVQKNLVRSHSAGVGEPLDAEVVRGMMLLQAASLSRGHSGCRVELIQQIIELLNRNVTPVVPSRGSVGASGDLAPLSHAALVYLGEGEAVVDGALKSGADALAHVGLSPIVLEAKEGLALINGTHLMAAIASLALCDVDRLQAAALVSAASAIDACRGSDVPLDDRLHAARCQIGQRDVAAALRSMLEGSTILSSHKVDDPRVQDPYCLRATPQVLGAVFDTIAHVRTVIERELGGVTDNPLVFAEGAVGEGDVCSGGNFHGMPLAIAMDTMSIALAHMAGIAERRIYWLLQATDSENPVNIYLSPQPGLHSGLMIVQYTAAACCNEIQTLCAPASVANIPTSAGIEDYNSMGATSAHQLRQVVARTTDVIAMELLVMHEALEYQRPLTSGAAVESAYAAIRSVVPRLTEDRPPSPDIAAIGELIRSGAIMNER